MSRYQEKMSLRLNWQGGLSDKTHTLIDDYFHKTIPNDVFGVYVIWEFFMPGCNAVIKVGQGKIKDRLSAHRNDERIVGDGSKMRIILAAWAEVDKEYVDGVEAYLGRVLDPSVGKEFPKKEEISVNLTF